MRISPPLGMASSALPIRFRKTRSIRAHYETDAEFQQSVNRYVHDFEAMMRRVVSDKDGGIIAVTLMSSDTGKLYAALSQVVDKKR